MSLNYINCGFEALKTHSLYQQDALTDSHKKFSHVGPNFIRSSADE